MKILFIDESGDHSLIKIDMQYPIFVLAGIIMDSEYHDQTATNILKQTKIELFGTDSIIFHTSDINRNRNGFERLKDRDFRTKFYDCINKMMSDLDYMVVAVAILKEEHLKVYGLAALDPYLLSLECIVERFVFELQKTNENGLIIAERRNSILDNELELSFLNLKIQGTRYIQAVDIKKRIEGFLLRSKEENIAGLQVADLVASPIGRYILGKEIKPDFKIVKQKFRHGRNGRIEGYGLIVLPKKQRAGPATQFPPKT